MSIKKSISYLLILSIVLSMALPMRVMAEGKINSGEYLFDFVINKFSDVRNMDDATKAYGIMKSLYDKCDNLIGDFSRKLSEDQKKILRSKGINEDNMKNVLDKAKEHLLDNKDIFRQLIENDENKLEYETYKGCFEEIARDIYNDESFPEELKKTIEQYASPKGGKKKLALELADEFKNDTFGTATYNESSEKYTNLNLSVSEDQMEKVNDIIRLEGEETGPLTKDDHLDIVNKGLEVIVNQLKKEEGRIDTAADLLVRANLIEKRTITPEEPVSPVVPTPKPKPAPTPTPTPKVPGETVVPEDSTKPATGTIGKKEVTIKEVEGVTVIEVKEDETIATIKALRKEAGKDRKAILVVKLDDVKGTNVELLLSGKIFAALYEEKVDLNIVTKDLEHIIPFDALKNVSIPKDASLRLVTKDVDKDIVKNQEKHHNVKNVLDIYMEIVKKDNVTRITKFNSPITVKINVKNLGNKDKLAVYYLNEKNNLLEFVTGKIIDGKVILKLDHLSKYVIIESTKTFPDIAKHWSKLYVESMAAKNVVDGYKDGTFKPNINVTRAEFSKMIVQGLEAEVVKYNGEFKDIKADDWHANYIATMKKLGLVQGYKDGTFRPNEKITRAEMAMILSNIIDVEVSEGEINTILAQFKDKSNIQSWAKEAIAKVVKANVMIGKNGKFDSNDNATRAEAATTIYRIY